MQQQPQTQRAIMQVPHTYNRSLAKIQGFCLCISGLVCLVSNVVLMVNDDPISRFSAGIVGGAIVSVLFPFLGAFAGAWCILSGLSNKPCPVMAGMVLLILTFPWLALALVQAVINLSLDHVCITRRINQYISRECRDVTVKQSYLVVFPVLMIVSSIISICFGIWGLRIICKAASPCCGAPGNGMLNHRRGFRWPPPRQYPPVNTVAMASDQPPAYSHNQNVNTEYGSKPEYWNKSYDATA